MASSRAISRGEHRDIRCSPLSGLSPAQRAFAQVSVEWFNGPPVLQIVFGDLYFEMDEPLARDFGARIARAMATRIKPGSRRGFRCTSSLSAKDREYVEVFMQDDLNRTWLRLEFADGNTIDFSVLVGQDFAQRIDRAIKALPAQEKQAA